MKVVNELKKNSIVKTCLGILLAAAVVLASLSLPVTAQASENAATEASESAAAQASENDATEASESAAAQASEYATLQASSCVANGKCGPNVSWRLTESGELILSGVGMTDAYIGDNNPFKDYTDYITSITVGEGITGLNANIFRRCALAEKCTLPSTLEYIGMYAFYHCEALKELIIPDSVVSIGANAFMYCTQLESVTLPAAIGSIPESLFGFCEALKSIDIPDTVKRIGESAFKHCTQLESVELPDGISLIPDSTFDQCYALSSINIPESVTEIDDYAFRDCSSLASVTFADGSQLETIATYAFAGCASLERIELPAALTDIMQYAFSNCISLQEIILPDSLKVIGESAFAGCMGLTDIFIPANVRKIDLCAFDECYYIENIEVSTENKYYSSVDGILFNKDQTVLVRCPEGHGGTDGFAYEVPATVKEIGEGAFYNCIYLTSISLHEGVKSIGKYAFDTCTGLVEFTIPKGITTVTDSFGNCYQLQKITIPDSVYYIEPGAFSSCYALTEINVDAGNPCYTDVDGVLFTSNMNTLVCYPQGKTDEKYDIPESVTTLADAAFYGCYNLTSLTIPSGVDTIGEGAFYCCSGLTELTLPEGINAIGTGTFSGCSGLTSLVIPANVCTIGDSAFNGCSSLETISLPESLAESIGDSAFYMCSSLRSICIPEGVTELTYSIFSFCESLESVTIPDGVTKIDGNAFFGCTSLSMVQLPESVKQLGSNAFKFCSAMESINIPESITVIPEAAFSSCESLKEIILPDGLTSIGSWAFEECTALTTILLPESLKTINEGAFAGCNVLKYVIRSTDLELSEDTLVVDKVDGIVFTDDNRLAEQLTEMGIFVCSLGEWDAGHPIEDCTITLSSDGTAVESVSNGLNELTEGVSYTFANADGCLTVTGCGAYSGTVRFNLSGIETSLDECDIYVGQEAFIYEWWPAEPLITITFGSYTLAEGVDYKVEYTDNTAPGTATVKITGIGNFTGTVSRTFEVFEESIESINLDIHEAVMATSVACTKEDGTITNPYAISEASTLQLTAEVVPSLLSESVVWTSSNPGVASVDDNGLVTAYKYSNSPVVITASSYDGTVMDKCYVTTRYWDVAGNGEYGTEEYQYWFNPVYWAAAEGITVGYGNVYFGSERECSRRELMIFLWRMAGKPEADDYTGSERAFVDPYVAFSDMDGYDTSTATYKAVAWGATMGITKGFSNGTFRPNDSVTRRDTMIMIYRMAGCPSWTATRGDVVFTDVAGVYGTETATYNAIGWAYNAGITNGYTKGELAGQFGCSQNILRKDIVTLLYRYINL